MVSVARFVRLCAAVVAAMADVSTSYVDDNVLYDISWEDKKDMPFALSDATASVVNGRVYIVGGCDADWGNSNQGNRSHPDHACKEISDQVLVYNPLEDSWTISTSKMQYARYRHAAVVVGTDIYVIGGRDVKDNVLVTVMKYSTAADTWTVLFEFVDATSDNAAFEHEGKVITCGGYPKDYSISSRACYVMDPSLATPTFEAWSTPLATGRGDFSIVKLDGMAYAYGGFDSYKDSWTAFDTIEKIDPSLPDSSRSWVTLPNMMQHGRGDFAAATVHGRVLAIGGENSSNTMDAGASLRHVEAYNPKTGQWLSADKLKAIPHATFRFCGATVGEGVYVFGGQGAHDAECDCYRTKAGVFVYNENLTALETPTSTAASTAAPTAALTPTVAPTRTAAPTPTTSSDDASGAQNAAVSLVVIACAVVVGTAL